MKRTLLLLAGLALGFALFAQPVGSWNVLSLRAKVTRQLQLYGEAQLRSANFYNNFFYYELKGGINFAIDKHFNVLLGGGRYITYLDTGNFETPFAAREWRIWQEFGMKQEIYRLFFEHRYRIEERFFDDYFKMRFRYRLSLLVPINHKDFQPNTVYVAMAEELFLTNQPPFFERNRLYFGVGYKFRPVAIQIGWMNQYDYKPNISKNKNYFQIMALFDLDFSKGNGKYPVPLQAD